MRLRGGTVGIALHRQQSLLRPQGRHNRRRSTYFGVRNVLAHLDVIAAPEGASAVESTVYLDAVNELGGVLAPFEGLFEAQYDVGDEVDEGQIAGVLYSIDEVGRPPKELLFTGSGIVGFKSVSARVVHGSRICTTAKAVTHDELLALADAKEMMCLTEPV